MRVVLLTNKNILALRGFQFSFVSSKMLNDLRKDQEARNIFNFSIIPNNDGHFIQKFQQSILCEVQ